MCILCKITKRNRFLKTLFWNFAVGTGCILCLISCKKIVCGYPPKTFRILQISPKTAKIRYFSNSYKTVTAVTFKNITWHCHIGLFAEKRAVYRSGPHNSNGKSTHYAADKSYQRNFRQRCDNIADKTKSARTYHKFHKVKPTFVKRVFSPVQAYPLAAAKKGSPFPPKREV